MNKIEFSRQTTPSPGYSRRKKESVSDLEIRQEERLQRSLICTAIARTLAVCVAVCVLMRFILFSAVTCITDVIDYHMNSIPVIKSQDDLAL